MTKQQYMNELERVLTLKKISDTAEILAEYEEHFKYKTEDGYGEEEICASLASPESIAGQYLGGEAAPARGSFAKAAAVTGLVFFGLAAVPALAAASSLIIAGGATAISFCALAVFLPLKISLGIIPYIPYGFALLLAVSFAALALLCSIGTFYYTMLCARVWKLFFRWNKNIANGGSYPSLPIRPEFSKKTSRFLRKGAVISSLVFGAFLIIAFAGLMIYTGFKPFWHELNWFV